MAICLSGIPLNFIVLSFQLIAKILETSIEKQTDITARHTVFLKILLLNFRKIVGRTASHFIVSLKKMFFFFNSTKPRYEQSLTLHLLA